MGFRHRERMANFPRNRLETAGIFQRSAKLSEPRMKEMQPREHAELVGQISKFHRKHQASLQRAYGSRAVSFQVHDREAERGLQLHLESAAAGRLVEQGDRALC